MADDSLDLLRQELVLHREESRTYLERMHEKLDGQMRKDREESRREWREAREINGMLLRGFEQLVGRLDEMRLELRAQGEAQREDARAQREDARVQREDARVQREDARVQREGFFSLIDELRRHGLGGAPG